MNQAGTDSHPVQVLSQISHQSESNVTTRCIETMIRHARKCTHTLLNQRRTIGYEKKVFRNEYMSLTRIVWRGIDYQCSLF